VATERERYELPPALAASAAGRGRPGFEDGFEPTDSAAVPSKGRSQTPMCQHPRCEWEAGHYPAAPTGHSESGRGMTPMEANAVATTRCPVCLAPKGVGCDTTGLPPIIKAHSSRVLNAERARS
jgi:hypothetical protein